MNKLTLAALALSGLALTAQSRTAARPAAPSRAVTTSKAVTLLYTMSKPSDFAGLTPATRLETDTYKGFGLRYSQTAGSMFGARLDAEGTWKLRTSGSDLKVGGVVPPPATTESTMHHESIGLGLSAVWTGTLFSRSFDYGFALDVRQDNTSYRTETAAGVINNYDQSVVRPWLGLRGGYNFSLGSMKSFLGLEYGIPLSKREGGDTVPAEQRGRKLRPKSEMSLALGMRF